MYMHVQAEVYKDRASRILSLFSAWWAFWKRRCWSRAHTYTHTLLPVRACLPVQSHSVQKQSESSDGPELKLGWYGWDVTVRHVYLSLANLWWCTCLLNPLHHSTTSPSLPCNLFANYLINIVYCGKTGVVVVFLSIYNLRISPHVLILPS